MQYQLHTREIFYVIYLVRTSSYYERQIWVTAWAIECGGCQYYVGVCQCFLLQDY